MPEDAFIACFWRYHVADQEECDTLGEALDFLAAGFDRGDCAPVSVSGPDGRVLLEGDALQTELVGRLDA